MSGYYCTASKGKPNYPNCSIGGTHLPIVPINENPNITDEFPNAGDSNTLLEIQDRRTKRSWFWSNNKFFRGRP